MLSQSSSLTFLYLLGKGRGGEVWLVENEKGEKLAAKKCDRIHYPDLALELQDESRILQNLNHPNIVQFKELREDGENLFLLQELLIGTSLEASVLYNGPFTESIAKNIIRQIVNALLYLHGKRIVHQDLKASNVILGTNLHATLIDFGFATTLDANGESDSVCGSPFYIAPEIWLRKPHGVESDVWALGVILYFLVVGTHPFSGQEVEEVMHQIVETKYVCPKKVSPEFLDLLGRMLEKDPKNRISLIQLLQHPWFTKKDFSMEDSHLFASVSTYPRYGNEIIRPSKLRRRVASCTFPQSRNALFSRVSKLLIS